MCVSKESKQVSCNAITVHSTVYMYVSKESKQVSRNPIYFIQSHDLDAHKSWYELGQEVGLDIICSTVIVGGSFLLVSRQILVSFPQYGGRMQQYTSMMS